MRIHIVPAEIHCRRNHPSGVEILEWMEGVGRETEGPEAAGISHVREVIEMHATEMIF